MSRNLVELSGPALAEALSEDSVLVLPTGSIEHHGPHLPLNTDLLLAQTVAESAVAQAAEAGVDVWVLPALAYTKSDEHAWAPGTIWLSWDTLMRTVVDIGRSVAGTPARRLVFVNGHGGNVALLQVALRELRIQFGLRTFLLGGVPDPGLLGDLGRDELGLGIHGGLGETSMVLYLRPDLVDVEQAVRHVPPHLAEYAHIGFHGKPVSFGWTSDDFGTGGVVGDPTGASAELGGRLVGSAVANTVAALSEIASFTPRRD